MLSTGGNKNYIKTALQEYKYPDMVKTDVLSVFTTYTDLRPKLEPFVFNDGTSKDLLCLEGTVPVSYKGNTYNVPVCLWVLDTHPYNPPIVYVKPTSAMRIRSGRHVDANGKIDLPYLREWKYPQSDLLGLVHVLCIVFGEEPPVYATGGNTGGAANRTPYPGNQASTPTTPAGPEKGRHENSSCTSLDLDSITKTALQKYRYPDMAKRDVLSVFNTYPDLRPKLEPFVFNDGISKDLLCLEGTIPVSYKGNTYNVPVCLWVLDAHPYNPPIVYVKPTSAMRIRSGRHVDANGKIDLPYLREWKYPRSDLLGLVHVLCIVFGEEPPVYATGGNTGGAANRTPYPGNQASTPNTPAGPDIAERDADNVCKIYTDLRPKKEPFVFNDGASKNLLCLEGTMPISCEGNKYDIPVCLWMSDTHPYSPPYVYVKSISTMRVRSGEHVDADGKVDLPYLRDWKYPQSNLLELLHVLCLSFGDVPPVYITEGGDLGTC